MTISPAIGSILVRWRVEQAAVATLNEWLGMYLSEIERQLDQPDDAIPRPVDIYGSLDDKSGEIENSPAVIVTAQSTGDVYRQGSGEMNEWYRIEVVSVVAQGNERDARYLADVYGAATQAAVLQGWSQTLPTNGINTIASDLAVHAPPVTAFWGESETRHVTMCTASFDAFISSTVASAVDGLGAIRVPVDDFNDVPDVPTVDSTLVTFIGESADGSTTETNPE